MERPPMERALSTDVVLDIVLSHLRVRDLLSCRKVSKFWNKAASSVLRRRSTMIKNMSGEADLIELEEYIEQNSDFPFAGLRFDESWSLNSPDGKQFFKKYGEKFTSLYWRISRETRIQDIAPVVNHLPRLSILEMGCSLDLPQRAQLFDTAAGQEGGRILILPSLRTLRIDREINQDILREICTAASPSLRIECLNTTTYGNLKSLKSVGKLHAVSVIDVDSVVSGMDDALRVTRLLSTVSLTLTKLDFDVDSFQSLKGLKKILISSQYTLKNLRLVGIYPSQLSSDCPVLHKLTTLSLLIDDDSYEYIFQGSQGHKFPALKELKLDTNDGKYKPSSADLSAGKFIVPNLTKILLEGHVDKYGIEDLARSFPNVIEISLDHVYYADNPSEIWSFGAFKFLERLRIWGYGLSNDSFNLEKFKMINMDSFLTGIPLSICENLRQEAHQNLNESPFNRILRDSPNIFQLKNLKELTVCVDPTCMHGLEELPEEPPFISMVSVWYALDMIPDLQAKFVYESPSWRLEKNEWGKAVELLKVAFKNVQPHVELQPFFY